MSRHDLIVVSEKFSEFALHTGAVTPQQVKAMLLLPAALLPQDIVLHPGQGLPDSEIADLMAAVRDHDPDGVRWNVGAFESLPGRAHPTLSHKRKACNTLIAEPAKVDERTFAMDLCIDQNCELMDDHQTGQHVQGMVLIEAARQAFLAVTEAYFLRSLDQQSYFVINSISSEFKNFVFPIRAELLYRVLDQDVNERRQKFEVEIDLVQCNSVCMATKFSFTVYPASVIAQKERGLAEIAAKMALHGPGASTVAQMDHASAA